MCGVTPSSSTLEVARSLHPVECRLVCAELRTFVWAEGVTAGMGLAPRKDRPATLNRRGAFAANEWQPLLWAAKENHLQVSGAALAASSAGVPAPVRCTADMESGQMRLAPSFPLKPMAGELSALRTAR